MAATKNRYAVHPAVRMMQAWIATLKEKTGRTLEEWMSHIRAGAPVGQEARAAWLKDRHGLGTNVAGWLARRATDPASCVEEETDEGYLAAAARHVEAQYAGKKAALRPIYERLLELGLSMGPDARACPCKTMVPLFREHVFANITPSTNARVDLGLALAKLPEAEVPARLVDTGGRAKKDRITHRIPLGSVGDIDAFVESWLRRAYELDGPDGPARPANGKPSRASTKKPARKAAKTAPSKKAAKKVAENSSRAQTRGTKTAAARRRSRR